MLAFCSRFPIQYSLLCMAKSRIPLVRLWLAAGAWTPSLRVWLSVSAGMLLSLCGRGEESEYPFFEGDGSSFDEWRDYSMAGDDYEGPPVFDDDQYEEESVPVYDTDIEDVIEEEE
ncbi:hypothetical protein Tco_0926349 [Tanacetum coccineum]|uniref:Secreted protein n=1 Tax=Tanacetum coccineum TaxID=301880 RepID=A0ABQ5D9K2_9ASTR